MLARLYKQRQTLIFRLMIMRPNTTKWTKTLRKFELVSYKIWEIERGSD